MYERPYDALCQVPCAGYRSGVNLYCAGYEHGFRSVLPLSIVVAPLHRWSASSALGEYRRGFDDGFKDALYEKSKCS